MLDLVSIGEPLIAMTTLENCPLRHASFLKSCVGGAALNVAVGLVRFGHSAGLIGRVGDDEFGQRIVALVRGEGVDVSHLRVDGTGPTGLFFKEVRALGDNRAYYYRQNSAGSRLSPDDLEPEYIASARYLHISGDVIPLSVSCRQAMQAASEMAKRFGTRIVLDPNLRLKLWSAAEARQTLQPLIRGCHLVLATHDEAEILLGRGSPLELAQRFLDQGVETAVIKLGAQGALAANHDGSVECPAYPVPRVLDSSGAGDAFAVAFLSGQLRRLSLEESVLLGTRAGALATSVVGSVESMPTIADVLGLLDPGQLVTR